MKQTIALQCSDQIAEAFLRRAPNELEAPDRILEQPFRMSENENEHNFETDKKTPSSTHSLIIKWTKDIDNMKYCSMTNSFFVKSYHQ